MARLAIGGALFFTLAVGARGDGAAELSDQDLLRELDLRGVTVGSGAKKAATAELSTAELVRELIAREKPIYGVDDRRELYEVWDPRQFEQAGSVAALVRTTALRRGADDRWGYQVTNTFRSFGGGLCPDEKFGEQPTLAFCSSFLVAPRLVVTAGHCVESSRELATFKVVFGYALRGKGELAAIPDGGVYSAVKLRGRREEDFGADWAVLELDRDVEGRRPLRLRQRDVVPSREPVYVIGFPAGLPMKVAGGATVRDNQAADYFVANLDAFGGNSGSPVFSEISGDVEGILVRGAPDFVRNAERQCASSRVCPSTGCKGEVVSRILAVPQELLQ